MAIPQPWAAVACVCLVSVNPPGTPGLVRRAAQQAAPVGTRLHVGPRADADGGRRRCVQLTCSCCVMTAAWYLHLKYKEWPIWKAILFSWLFALGEYCLQVAER